MNMAMLNLYKAVDQPVPSGPPPLLMQSERFKHKFHFVPLQRNFIDVMDAMKVADFTVMLMSAEVEVDKFGINCLLGILNQGLVSPIPVVQHLERTAPKLRNNIKKSLVSFVQQFYPEESRVHTLDSEAEAMTVLRMVATQRPRSIKWREQHPYLLAEHVQFDEQEGQVGTLKVTGVARGTPFNANRLVHLQNFGDFQIEKVRLEHTSAAAIHQTYARYRSCQPQLLLPAPTTCKRTLLFLICLILQNKTILFLRTSLILWKTSKHGPLRKNWLKLKVRVCAKAQRERKQNSRLF